MNIKIIKILATVLFCAFFKVKSLELIKFSKNASESLMGQASTEDVDAIQRLINNRANVNFQKKGSGGTCTPLYYAIMNSYLGVVKCLIYNGADINIKVSFREFAAKCNAIELAKKRLEELKASANSIYYPSSEVQRENAKKVIEFLEKHARRMQKICYKNLKYVTQKVNEILPQLRRVKISNAMILPAVLENMVSDYCGLYPENSEDFYKLSDQEIDEIIKIYANEFEKNEIDVKETNEKLDRIYNENCSIM